MERISKSPRRAVQLCSGNLKQLRKTWPDWSTQLFFCKFPSIFQRIFSPRKCGMCMILNNIQTNFQAEQFKLAVSTLISCEA